MESKELYDRGQLLLLQGRLEFTVGVLKKDEAGETGVPSFNSSG